MFVRMAEGKKGRYHFELESVRLLGEPLCFSESYAYEILAKADGNIDTPKCV